MRGLVVRYPWVELIANGTKRLEIRSWKTSYRGPVTLIAAAALSAAQRELCERLGIDPRHRGHVLCVGEIVGCFAADNRHTKAAGLDVLGPDAAANVLASAYALDIRNVRRVDPSRMSGKLGLFRMEAP